MYYENNHHETTCNLTLKLKDIVNEIVAEIKRILQGKYGVSYTDIVNYIQGHGEWDFDILDKRGLIRGEIIGNLSGQELGKIIE